MVMWFQARILSWQPGMVNPRDGADATRNKTSCIFTELAGFYTLETVQDKSTVGSGIVSGWIRSRTLIGNYWREMLKQ